MSVYWQDTDNIGPKLISCKLEQEKGIQLSWRQSLLCTSFIKKEKKKALQLGYKDGQGKANSSLLNQEERVIIGPGFLQEERRARAFWRERKEIQHDGHGEVPTHTIGIVGEQGELESLLCSLHSIICPLKNIEPPSIHQTLCLDPGRFTNIPLRGRASAVVAQSKQKTENYLQGVGRVYLISYKLGIKLFHVTVAVYNA